MRTGMPPGGLEPQSLAGCLGLLLGTAVALYIAWDWLSLRRTKFRAIPGAWPVLGHLRVGKLARTMNAAQRFFHRHRPTEPMEYRIGPRQKVLVLPTYELVQEMLRLRPVKLQRQRASSLAIESFFPSVFTAEGASWGRQRRLVSPAFSHRQVAEYLPHIQTIGERLCEVFGADAGQPRGIRRVVRSAFIDLISLVAFNRDFRCTLRHSQEAADVDGMVRRVFLRLLLPSMVYRLFPNFDGGKALCDRLRRLVDSLIVDARRGTEDAAATVLGKLLQENSRFRARGEEASVLGDELLRGNLMILFVAGSETTAVVVMWMLWALATMPEFQARAAAEASAFQDTKADRSLDEVLRELPLMRSLFWEALRKYGPAHTLFTENAERMDFLGKTLEAREYWICAPTTYLVEGPIAEDYGISPDPHVFDPARWYDEATNTLKPIPEVLTLRFGGASRICPGRHLAEMDAVVTMAMVLRKFALGAAPGHAAPKPTVSLSRLPDIEMRLVFSPRVGASRRVDTAEERRCQT